MKFLKNLKYLFLYLFLLGCGIASAQTHIYNLKCCDKESLIGAEEKPYFGWNIINENSAIIQSAYQILVASSKDLLNEGDADLWNSGQVESSMQNYIYYSGNDLSSATKYYWKVKIWDSAGIESDYSEVDLLTTGLLTNNDWSGAKWIKRVGSDNEDYTYFRKTISLNSNQIEQATVFVSAVHDFELYMNGDLVGKGPGYHYPQYQYYNAFDITDKLNSNSDNLFACLTHWYGGGQGRPTSSKGFLFKAIIKYVDGSSIVINSDNTWKIKQVTAFATGQDQRNSEGVGYVDKIDSREIITNWNALDYDDSSWFTATEIGAHPVSPWTGELQVNHASLIEEELTPVSVTNKGNGTYVIDLGKVYAGVPEIHFSGGTSGTQIKILGGYTLSNGYVSTSTVQNTDMSYYFILNGGTAVFKPMVYLGMRYIQVNNSPNELNTDNVKFVARHYELDPDRSSFSSSNEMLNQVWDLMKRSLVVGSQESFVDTPTREKGGFLGDSWSVGSSAMQVMGERVMNFRILNEFITSQKQYWSDGRLNAVYPNVDGGRDIPDYTQMFLFWVWDYYMQTGNVEFLQSNYNEIFNVANYVSNHINSTTGLIHKLTGGTSSYKYGIIDWPKNMRYGYDTSVDSRTVMNAYAYQDFTIMAQIAEVLGITDVQEEYNEKANNIKVAINDRLIDEQGVYIDGLYSDYSQSSNASQHANMLPLALGIVPDQYQNNVETLVKDKEMSVGMVTLRWLPEAIGYSEEGEHLIDLYTNSQWDGWAKIIALGGTMTWESWDALYTGESMSHPWGAVGLIGLQQFVLGVKALKCQHELIQIKPLWFGEQLTNVNGIVPTDRGDIDISWEKNESVYNMTVIIPDNMTGKIYIPIGDATGDKILLNDSEIDYEVAGNYFYIGEYGPGEYNIVRYLNQGSTPVIAPSEDNQWITITPNPIHDKMYLKGNINDINMISVISLSGKVCSQVKNPVQKEIDISDLDSGIYIVKINCSQRTLLMKIVKV